MNEATPPNEKPVTAFAMSEPEKNVIIAGARLSMLLAALDQTIVASVMPTIGKRLAAANICPGS
ncbi:MULTISPECIES: hypothetical protein [Rhizobium]|uniref:Uncharacterized protein n=1 Tax=Rhizobium paranaense TaxID=1650438 RepID=A0A7W8XU82_9HYPH|nr:hypothetical protein [Rhizobium paranaense]